MAEAMSINLIHINIKLGTYVLIWEKICNLYTFPYIIKTILKVYYRQANTYYLVDMAQIFRRHVFSPTIPNVFIKSQTRQR